MNISKGYASIIAVLVTIIIILAGATGYFWAKSNEQASGTPTQDTQAPSKVDGLIVVAADSESLLLSWNDAMDNVAVEKYNIYRDGSKIAESTDTAHQDTGLTSGETYTYQVSAVDGAGNEGQKSSSVDGTPSDCVSGGTKHIGTSVAKSGDGKNWTVTFSSVDGGMAGYQIYLIIKDKGGAIALPKTALSSLVFGVNDADYIDISGDGDETNDVTAGDYLLISTLVYTTGFTYDLLYGAGIAASGALQ